jgi:hypothetical protein
MTDEATPEATEAMTAEVPFKGRTVHMRMPTPEQILVWKRTIRRFEDVDAAGLNAGQALDAIDRCVRIITSLFALPKDVDWLEDSLLDRTVTLGDLLELFASTVEEFSALARAASGTDDNRASRRAAAKPAKKVVRKKATKSTGKAVK